MAAPAGRILGLDLGSRRIGLALSDAELPIAFPEGVLQRRGLQADLQALDQLARERDVRAIVVGLPIHMSGRRGPEAEAARRFADALAEATGLPVSLQDERWTSLEARRSLAATGRRRARELGEVDAVAASLLLRAWLERERKAR